VLPGYSDRLLVCIGRAHAFPRIHTGRATFTASGVPVLDVTSLVLACEVEDLGRPSEAHQFEHGTTRRVTTPTLLESKMPLLGPSSAFLTSSLVPLVKRLSLANLHHVSPITGEHWATTLPPPSVPRAGILAPLPGQAVSEFPSSV
jgi:hypothetical protein